MLERLDNEESDQPWLTVCSFLNPHDIALFGVIALTQGLRYDTGDIPEVANAPTHDEDLSTKPACQQSYVDAWGKMLAPQPWIETHRKFYYQLQGTVDAELAKVLDALRATKAYENTIVVFLSDHGDMLGAHGGMHQKWHNAYEETTHVPFLVSSPLIGGGQREIDALDEPRRPASHSARFRGDRPGRGVEARLGRPHGGAAAPGTRPLRRDLRQRAGSALGSAPVRDGRRDQRGQRQAGQPLPAPRDEAQEVLGDRPAEPHRDGDREVEVDGAPHLVKFSRYHDNQQFWTVPGERDERLHGRNTITVTEPEPDEYELYDLTLDPLEERNLAHPSYATDDSRRLQETMLELLAEQVGEKRLGLALESCPATAPPQEAAGAAVGG